MQKEQTPKRPWEWILEANRHNPLSDEELAELGVTRDQLDWQLDKEENE